MTEMTNNIISETVSLCPECLKRIPARNVQKTDGNVYLEKECPEHGHFSTVIWRGEPDMREWGVRNLRAHLQNTSTIVRDGCPLDCGLCPDHQQHPCCVLFEVTRNCDLGCPVCYAGAGKRRTQDMSRDSIRVWYQTLMEKAGVCNIQLSGGEPSTRDDLPEIIRDGRNAGFSFFQLNTNGIRIANEIDYLFRLKEAGLSAVYLQFDGMDDAVYRKIRGRDLFETKMRAIENCKKAEIGVTLVPTIIPGVNDHQLGRIAQFGADNLPTVRCVHIQPVCYMGRYDHAPANEDRITLPEVFSLIEAQTDGKIKRNWFKPGGGQHPACAFQMNFVVMEDGSYYPLTKFEPNKAEAGCCCAKPVEANVNRLKAQNFVAKTWRFPEKSGAGLSVSKAERSFGAWDQFMERKKTHQFTISGMAFQDVWTLDVERVKDCYIIIMAPDNRMVPFCAYNLTDRAGNALYRQ